MRCSIIYLHFAGYDLCTLEGGACTAGSPVSWCIVQFVVGPIGQTGFKKESTC